MVMTKIRATKTRMMMLTGSVGPVLVGMVLWVGERRCEPFPLLVLSRLKSVHFSTIRGCQTVPYPTHYFCKHFIILLVIALSFRSFHTYAKILQCNWPFAMLHPQPSQWTHVVESSHNSVLIMTDAPHHPQ